MTATELDERTALVLIDLQQGFRHAPTAPLTVMDVVPTAARLARVFRAKELPVVLVRVVLPTADPTEGGPPRPRADRAMPVGPPMPGHADFVPELEPADDDIVITKRAADAFHGTGLDQRLRRRGVTGLVLGGIATSMGVESTARATFEYGYNLTVVSDAVTDLDPDAHHNTLTRILPRFAEIDTAEAVLKLLR